MSDAVVPETVAAPAAPVVVEAPPVAAPTVVEAPAPVATPEPVAPAAPAPVAEAPAGPALKPHTDTPDLLAEPEKAPEPVKPEEKPPEAVVPEAPKYEFKFPETVKAAPEQVEALSTLLGGAKVDQETAQKLVDMHVAEVQKYAENTLIRQHQAFADTRAGWRKEIQSDPVLGGAGFETTKNGIMEMIRRFVPEEEKASFAEWRQITGSGDHPAFWRLMNRVARTLKQPAPVQPGTPPGDIGRAPKGGPRDMYSHPTSIAARNK